MNFDEILAKFPDAKKSGDGWAAKCPAHLDGSPSLTISEGADGRALLHCFAGCTTAAICDAVGLTLADLFPPRAVITPTPATNGSGKRILATYDYTDVAGNLLFQVVRYLPKDFRQRRPDGKGGWIWNMDGLEKVLFRLPEIIRAIAGGKFIFLTEGERDTLAMVQSGFDATCNPGGAGKWLAGYTETLRGADVVIVADKDAPGRKHALLVASKLHGVAKSVRVLELPDANGKPVKDAADFFAAGGTAESIFELVDTALIWTPPAALDPLPGNENELTEADAATIENNRILDMLAKRRFDYNNPPPPVEPRFFINDIPVSTAGNITTVSAQAKDGKTATLTAAMAATMAVEHGSDNLGWTSSNPSGFAVLHFDTEQSIEDHYAVGKRTTDRAGRADAPSWFLSYCLTGFTVRESRAAITLALAAAATQCGGIHSVFLDGSADFVCDVNDPAEANEFVASLHALAIEYHCPILAAIHLNPGSEFKTRGHLGSQLERKAESNLKLERDGDIITLFATRNRKAPISKDCGPRFQWSSEHHRHVSIGTVGVAKADARHAELREEADAVFEHAKKTQMSWTEIMDAIQSTLKVREGGARKRFDAMRGFKIITRNVIKKYELAP